ncbi:KpsF/GutQ family sugar-phosphate isomerase [Aestuariirhabdus sp. Z084]|uniref:KpsF/GutQ family sugar-phosphate isomerase n=1 Tax=Aestuariirhabdus haliotis TaxID=2918751 RepID=UPI00201B42F4|nr:KpsF/GutQ family sugar-phosphate isomerase [Aestuariirhabdus haliotis]MCL6415232.1 KpsF/GutQ family sugar-phosphate isomerase [Aestuariirhabdus haliotis]MCL6419492.1 KpsF/GutQ family sugar-phosphate isomerase [Aestuariirhabdus haliotis]
MTQPNSFKASGLRTVRMEQEAIAQLEQRIDADFEQACELLINCRGRIVVVGMGKSGHIGTKIAATLASTGSPAFFVHPGEASHGDMGMITADDVVITLSNSGNTGEMVTLIPLLKRLGVPMISMTGNPDSALAQAANVNLDTSVKEEACPLNLAPTSSTTVTLVMGDALAIALLEHRGFSAEDFAFSHPGGSLGRRLLLKVDDIMHSGERLPIVNENTLLRDALLVMTQKGLGMTAIVSAAGTLSGVFTDGDLRRSLDHELNMATTSIDDVMTRHCKTITLGMLAAEAVHIMEESKINGLIVIDDNDKPVGALNMHDLLKAGVV